MTGLPPEVRACARWLRQSVGIDEDSALSHAGEAWSQHHDPLWRTVAYRRCVDQMRGQRVTEVPMDLDVLDVACEDRGLVDVENRCTLSGLIADLPDEELAALARFYWLGVPVGRNTPPRVVLNRALRHAREV